MVSKEEELKIAALGELLGIPIAPGDDMLQGLGHDRLLGTAALHGKLVGE